jgi:O-antigen ligase
MIATINVKYGLYLGQARGDPLVTETAMHVTSSLSGSRIDRRSITAAFRHHSLAWASYLLALLMPFSLFWPISAALVLGVFIPYVTPGLYLPDIAIALTLIALVVNRRRLELGPLEISGPLAGLCLLALLTAPWALSTPLALYSVTRWIIACGVYLCFAQRAVRLERIVTIFIAGLCLQTIVGLAQVWAKGPLGLPGELALPNSADLAWTFRAAGFTFHPNVLGGFLAAGLLLSIPQLGRKVILLGWWLMWLGLLATFSRSAWLAVALTMPLVMFWHFRRNDQMRRTLISALLGLLVVFAVAGFIWREQMTVRLQPVVRQAQNALESSTPAGADSPVSDAADQEARLDQALTSSNYSLSERFVQVEIAFLAIRDALLHGIGAGNFPVFMRQHEFIIPPNYVHNVPLLLAAEIGVFGAGLWLTLCLLIAWWLIRRWPAADGWVIACLCAGLAIAVIALFDFYPWGLNSGRLLTAMVLGLIARTVSAQSISDQTVSGQ